VLNRIQVPIFLYRLFGSGNNSGIKPEKKTAQGNNEGPKKYILFIHMAIISLVNITAELEIAFCYRIKVI
jgi:hypothetical protein